jgi:2-hydroxy-6-oxonona-2,4-dienedioate hydrolase
MYDENNTEELRSYRERMVEPRQLGAVPEDDPWSEVIRLNLQAMKVITRFGSEKKKMVWRRWGDGVPLILFHGGGGSWTHWLRTLPSLSGRFAVWCPDLPGYGDSDLPDQPASYDDIANIVAECAVQFMPCGQNFDLVTFSLGGQIAVPFSCRLRNRIRRLILVGSNVIEPVRRGSVSFKNWKTAPNAADRDAAIYQNILNVMLHDTSRIDALALRLHRDNLARQRLSPAKLLEPVSLCDALSELPSSIALAGINGSNDFLIRDRLGDQSEAFLRHRPGAAFRAVEGGSHWVMYDRAEAFCKILLDLLECDDG